MLEAMEKAKEREILSKYRVSQYVAQRFLLDGGAMFGSVPKTLWEKKISADKANRIQLVSRILVLESKERKILIDIGCGEKWAEKERKIYGITQSDPRALHQIITGVTDVIITHLHFDHAGGLSYRDKENNLRLSYPEATHYVQEANWKRAQNPGPRERATYLSENVEPLKNARLELTSDGDEILPGIKVFRADGHTLGLQWVLIEDALACPSEMMPTAHHIDLPYVMGYDLCAETTMREKETFTKDAVANNWLLAFGHDANTSSARIQFNEKARAEILSTHSLPEIQTN